MNDLLRRSLALATIQIHEEMAYIESSWVSCTRIWLDPLTCLRVHHAQCGPCWKPWVDSFLRISILVLSGDVNLNTSGSLVSSTHPFFRAQSAMSPHLHLSPLFLG